MSIANTLAKFEDLKRALERSANVLSKHASNMVESHNASLAHAATHDALARRSAQVHAELTAAIAFCSWVVGR
jgi:hypothetical protein